MILIAHRGNVDGASPFENTKRHIVRALRSGFDAEVDVWYQDGWYLGHDRPEHLTDLTFLQTRGLWLHCKNYAALQLALERGLHCFYHASEDYALTSRGYIWAFPGMAGGRKTICVMPEAGQSVKGFSGVCSDHVARYTPDSV